MSKHLTEDQKQNIIKLLKEKGNASEVARIVGKSKSSVCRIAKKHKIPLKMLSSKVSRKEEEKILKLLKEGKSAIEVARLAKRSQTTVLIKARKHGIKFSGGRYSKVLL